MATTRVATGPGAATAERARVGERRGPRRRWVRPVLLWLAVVLICVFCLFPFYWLAVSAFKSQAEIFSVPPVWLPTPLKVQNFANVYRYLRGNPM